MVWEGELGIVLGAVCRDASEREAQACIFGYTCINDVTAADIIQKDPTFPQWARARASTASARSARWSPPTCAPRTRVRTIVNGAERQRYPVSDMVFPAAELVAACRGT